MQSEFQQLASAPAELSRHHHLLTLRQELDELTQQRQALTTQQQQAKNALSHQQGETERAERYATEQEMRWHQGQAALLALTLEQNAPCPVCGSLEHPAPAINRAELVTQAQVEEARAAQEQARQALQRAERHHHQLTQQIDSHTEQAQRLNQQLGEWASQPLSALQNAYEDLRRQVQRREQVDAEIRQQTEARDALRREWGTLDKQLKASGLRWKRRKSTRFA